MRARGPVEEYLEYYDEVLATLLAGRLPSVREDLLSRLEGIPEISSPTPASTAGPGKLNIALICREYPPDTAFGGMATFTYHLAHGLVNAGHRVAVVTAGPPTFRRDHEGRVDVVQIEPRISGVRQSFERLNRRGWLDWSAMVLFHSLGAFRVIRELEVAHGAFDVLDLADHCAEGLAPAMFWQGAKTVRLYSPWAILASMGLNTVAAGDGASLPILESALLHHTDVITSPSADLSARTRTFFDLTTSVQPVPNPLDSDHFRPVASKLIRRRGERARVCFVGRLEERKGIYTLIEAIPKVLSRTQAVDFDIFGAPAEDFVKYERLGRGKVRFRGRVPLTELPKLYQSATFSVVPSLYDNSPYSCIEPMACGIPVIGTNAGGMPEYVIDRKTGLIIAPNDADALADAIVELVEDPELCAALGKAAREHVVENLHFDRVAQLMEEQYRIAMRGGTGMPFATPTVVPQMNRAHPELNRIDAFIFATVEDGDDVFEVVSKAEAEGLVVTVVWDGRLAPGFERARTTGTSGNAGLDAARLLSSCLGQGFVLLNTGQELPRNFGARARESLARTGQARVQVDDLSVFRVDAALGLRLSDAATWDEVLGRVAGREIPT